MSSLGRVEVVEKGLKSSDLRLKTSKKLEKKFLTDLKECGKINEFLDESERA